MSDRTIIKRKLIMWSKITELREKEGYSKSKIARFLGIHRQTVSKYLSMSEAEYMLWLQSTHSRRRKLDVYGGFVKKQLERDSSLSAAAIHDRLREQFVTFPCVSDKTVYNFVEKCRKEFNLPKAKLKGYRQYERREETPYGMYAQVDFGEMWMLHPGHARHKVHFMVMVLCRSRQKFYYYQSSPFTSESAVLAHELAFEYFGGQPRKIIYDQDSVFLHKENLGDLILSAGFQSYVSQMDFEPVFCRAADPESKGMVENSVRFVKENFLRGRDYVSDEDLNRRSLEWLERTGNGRRHGTTGLIPMEEWEKERSFLIPVKPHQRIGQKQDSDYRIVLKNNTISYRGSFYTLPLGTYAGCGTRVMVREEDGRLIVSDVIGRYVTDHPVSHVSGILISNTSHRRDRTVSLQRDMEKVRKIYPNAHVGLLFEKVAAEKPRYLHDSVRVFLRGMSDIPENIVLSAVSYCLENRIFNTNDVVKVAHKMAADSQSNEPVSATPLTVPHADIPDDMVPTASSISTYTNIINK